MGLLDVEGQPVKRLVPHVSTAYTATAYPYDDPVLPGEDDEVDYREFGGRFGRFSAVVSVEATLQGAVQLGPFHRGLVLSGIHVSIAGSGIGTVTGPLLGVFGATEALRAGATLFNRVRDGELIFDARVERETFQLSPNVQMFIPLSAVFDRLSWLGFSIENELGDDDWSVSICVECARGIAGSRRRRRRLDFSY